ncbi:MAG: response regulator transcription factor, partial [Pedobacter sp.]
FKFSAADYLLKPIDEDELHTAIYRLKKRLADHTKAPVNDAHSRLALSTAEGVYLIDSSSIMRVEAMSNYSTFYLRDQKKIIVSKTLKEYENTLLGNNFLRISRSAIVNLDYVVKYRKGDGGTLEMTDGAEVEVSPSRKETLLEKLSIH